MFLIFFMMIFYFFISSESFAMNKDSSSSSPSGSPRKELTPRQKSMLKYYERRCEEEVKQSLELIKLSEDNQQWRADHDGKMQQLIKQSSKTNLLLFNAVMNGEQQSSK